MRPIGVVLAVAILGTSTGCATLFQAFAEVACQVGAETCAKACTDLLCDTDGATDVEVDDEGVPVPRVPDELPPPAWQPRAASCDVSHDDGTSETPGAVRIACPDGTRAVFVPMPPPPGDIEETVLEEEHRAAPDDPCLDGAVVLQGIDADHDGVLDPTEVTGRTVDCPDRDGVRAPTLVGHLAIHGPEDVVRLAGRRALTGGLIVRARGLVRLELPELRSVGGSLRVDGAPALEVLSMPQLSDVGADVIVSHAGRLQALLLPGLGRVGGGIVAVENPSLAQTDVEELVFRLTRRGFAGPVDLAGNAAR